MARTKRVDRRNTGVPTRGGLAGSQLRGVAQARRDMKKKATNGGIKPKRRWKAGTVALREIKRYQKDFDYLIPKAPFARLVREILDNIARDVLSTGVNRMQSSALLALQEATEGYVTSYLANVNLAAIHAKRITIQQKDSQFIVNLMKNFNVYPGKYDGRVSRG